MNKKISNQKGFTIIELLIVIVVIGILAGLVLNTFRGIQARARDTERQTDINAIATQLEVFHTDNGNYPLAITDASLFPGLDAEAVVAPNSGETYTYSPVESDGTTTCTAAADCASFTLEATLEDDGAGTYTKTSLN